MLSSGLVKMDDWWVERARPVTWKGRQNLWSLTIIIILARNDQVMKQYKINKGRSFTKDVSED